MAGLAIQKQSQSLPEPRVEAIAEQLAMGYHPRDIARVMYPSDLKAQRKAKRAIERAVRTDPRIYAHVLDHARMDLTAGIGPAIRGLVRRAKAGNPQASRLILEISGLHNPRVKHEHKGDIKIKLEGLPRPKFERSGIDDEIVDADVVAD